MQRRHRAFWAPLITGAFIVTALSGCVIEDAPHGGPVALLEAYRAALADVDDIDGRPHLVGFVGHEGRPPDFLAGLTDSPYLSGLIGAHVAGVDTTEDAGRGDGRAQVWVVLFATREGRLWRSTVTADPLAVHSEEVGAAPDPQIAALWGLNAGGRLVVDTGQAVAAARAADPAFDARIAAGARVTYASDIVPVGGNDRDLVHAVFVDDGGREVLVAHISHFTGNLLGVGPYASQREAQRIVVVDQAFTLNPVVREGSVERELPMPLSDARLSLETSGHGRFEFALHRENVAVWSTEGLRAGDNETARVMLGTLEPGRYSVHVSALGVVAFRLRVDGVVGL